MTGPDDQPTPRNHAPQANSPDANRELHRRTRTFALTASALTLTGVWAGYSWTQAHREGLQFQTADVAEALVSAVVAFAAGAALGGAARPLRRRFPRLAAYLTLVAPVLILGAVAVQEATDLQVGGSAPVVDVLGVACAILVAAMFGVRLTKARPARPVARWSTHVHACLGWSRAPLPGGGRHGERLRGRHGRDRRPVAVPGRFQAQL